MQAPRQDLKPALQVALHEVPLQVAVPFVGTGHGVHDRPQLLTLLFDTQVPPQLCVPVEHVPLHADVLEMHAPLHNLKPVLQVTPHDEPLQVAVPFAGTGHGVHDVPQLLTLLFPRHIPLHWCVPAGQPPVQDDEFRIQTPLQSLRPVGHRATHLPLEQVTVPFCGAAQGVHDTPQVATKLLLTHELPHMCCPDWQVSAAAVSSTSAPSPSSVMQEEPSNKTVQAAAKILIS